MVREVERGLLRCVQLVRERGARTIVVTGWSAGAQLVTQVRGVSISWCAAGSAGESGGLVSWFGGVATGEGSGWSACA